ncbi:hypothetical protein LC609_37485 [Nostoc sp. XA013]|nr:hypothetical protein [Nostoc sp. XA013]
MDKTRLIEAMRNANELAGKYQSSSRHTDAVVQDCEELRKAIHKLATRMTGDPEYFSYRHDPAPPIPTPDELDALATALHNAYHNHAAHKPVASFADIEARGIRSEIEEWNAIRSALELVPNTMYVALKIFITRLHPDTEMSHGD